MKHSATTLDPAAQPHEARASWPLPEPTLTYFPDVRFALSDRDLGAGASRSDRGGITVADDFGHVPVLADRCVELLTPALTRHDSDGSGAVLVDATLG
ncbi:MAG TPA: 16S rRNA (cytosine(1402)-N(4))-methyltransferase, partial [Mycobacterium sp.]